MKIVIVRSGNLGGGGMSRVIECWARILGTSGHATTVVSEASPSALELPSMQNVSSELTRSFAGSGRSMRLFMRSRVAVEKLKDLERRAGIDLIISHDSSFSGALRRAFPDTPLLQTFHSPAVDENRLNNWKYAPGLTRRLTYPLTWALFWQFERRALRSISCAHTLTDYTWSLLSARYPGRCRVLPWIKIPGSYDDGRFVPPSDKLVARKRLGLDPGKRLLLTVRRLVPRNAVERIVDCAGRLRGGLQDVEFLIGGTGVMENDLRRRIEAARVGDHVSLLGFIPEDELPLYYQAADAFLMPTRDLECFGLPVIEAMACGCLPLVMPHGGPAEICREHPEWIASENSSAAFTELVSRYLSGRIPAPARAIQDLAESRYSGRAIQPAILELVHRLVERDSG